MEKIDERGQFEPPAAPAVEAAAARVETELALAGDDPDSDPAFVTDLRTLIAHARASSPPSDHLLEAERRGYLGHAGHCLAGGDPAGECCCGYSEWRRQLTKNEPYVMKPSEEAVFAKVAKSHAVHTGKLADEKSERCPHGYKLANLRDGTDICAGCRFGVEAHETGGGQS